MKKILLLSFFTSIVLPTTVNAQQLTPPALSMDYWTFASEMEYSYLVFDLSRFGDSNGNKAAGGLRGSNRFTRYHQQSTLGFFSRGNTKYAPSPDNVNVAYRFGPSPYVSVKLKNAPGQFTTPFYGKMCDKDTTGCGGFYYNTGGSMVSDGVMNMDWSIPKTLSADPESYHFESTMSFSLTDNMFANFHNQAIGTPFSFDLEYCGSTKKLKLDDSFNAQTCDGRMYTALNKGGLRQAWVLAKSQLKHAGSSTLVNNRKTVEIFISPNGTPFIQNPSSETCTTYETNPGQLAGMTNDDKLRSGVVCKMFTIKTKGIMPGTNIQVIPTTNVDFLTTLAKQNQYYFNARHNTNIPSSDGTKITRINDMYSSYGYPPENWNATYMFYPRYILEQMVNNENLDMGNSASFFDFTIFENTAQGTKSTYFTFSPTLAVKFSPINYGVILKDVTIGNESRTATLPDSTPVKYQYELQISVQDNPDKYKGPSNKISIKLNGDSNTKGSKVVDGFVNIGGKNYCRFFSQVPDADGKYMEVAIPAYLAYQVGPNQFEKVKGNSSCGDPAVDITPAVSGGTTNPSYITQTPWLPGTLENKKGNYFKTGFELVFPLDDTISLRSLDKSTGASEVAGSQGVDWMGTTIKGSGRVEVEVNWFNVPNEK